MGAGDGRGCEHKHCAEVGLISFDGCDVRISVAVVVLSGVGLCSVTQN